MELNLISAGAAQGVVTALAEELKAESGTEIKATFGAVGAMRDKLITGAECDLIILTRAQLDELATMDYVLPETIADLGRVRTGIAVCLGDTIPDVSTAAALRASLLAANGIYFPDPLKATAGIHFANVLERLGISAELAPRIHTYPNGATAMSAMVEAKAHAEHAHLLGCTQITEINNTQGAVLVRAMPKEFELATMYSVGICVGAGSTAASISASKRFAAMLTGEGSRALRAKAGFEFA
ncbi:MAG: substrate-binding domain-containing protein [Usitatibacteraceae bacterium]